MLNRARRAETAFGVLVVLAASLGFTACVGSPTEPSTQMVVGVLFDQDSAAIAVAPSENGVEVTVITSGNGCYSMGEVVQAREGATITITPMDRLRTVSGQSCSDIGLVFRHVALVEIDEPRPWVIVVRARHEESSVEVSEFRHTVE